MFLNLPPPPVIGSNIQLQPSNQPFNVASINLGQLPVNQISAGSLNGNIFPINLGASVPPSGLVGLPGAPLQSYPFPVQLVNPESSLTVNRPMFGYKYTKQQRTERAAQIRKLESKLPRFMVKSISLSTYSAKQIREISRVKISSADERGVGSVNDHRLGTIDREVLCSTCTKNSISCPGHWGHIELPAPIYHPMFFKNMLKTLMSVCNSCGGLLLSEEDIKSAGLMRYTGTSRVAQIAKLSEGQPCRKRHGCASGKKILQILHSSEEDGVSTCKVSPNTCGLTQSARNITGIPNVLAAGRVIIPTAQIKTGYNTMSVRQACRPVHLARKKPKRLTLSLRPSFSAQPVLAKQPGSSGNVIKPVLTLYPRPQQKLVTINIPGLGQKVIETGGVQACHPNPKFKIQKSDDNKKVFYVDPNNKEKDNELPIECVIEILSNITQDDARILGFSEDAHPSNFIMENILVLPPCARPDVFVDGVRHPDQLTTMYKTIIKKSRDYRKAIKESDKKALLTCIFFLVDHLIDNTDGKYTQGQNGSIQTIKARIQGKEALFRRSMMGKRVGFFGRSVITPDPTLKTGQVGVPEIWAQLLTQPEKVTSINQGRLSNLLRQGKVTHMERNGILRRVTETVRMEQELEIGDIIHRWLQNGDYVIMNRQPTLHTLGMMGHEVVLHKHKSLTINPNVVTPYNADGFQS